MSLRAFIGIGLSLSGGLSRAASEPFDVSSLKPSGPASLPWKTKGRSIEFQELMKSVEERLPLTMVAQKQVEIAEARQTAARGAFDFRLEAQAGRALESYDQRILDASVQKRIDSTPLLLYGGWRVGQGEFRSYEGKLLTGDDGEWRVGLKLPLLRDLIADPERTRNEVTTALFRSSEYDARVRMLDLKRTAGDRYWDWINSCRALLAHLRLLKLAVSRFQQIERRVKAGGTAQIELVEIERMIVQRKAQLIESERLYQRNTLELSLYWRDLNGSPLLASCPLDIEAAKADATLTEIVDDEDAEIFLRNSLNTRPDLQSIEEQLVAARRETMLFKNQALPRLDLQLDYAKDTGFPKDSEREARGMLTFSFPLENREASGNRRAGFARLDQLEQSRIFMKDQATREVLNLESAMRAARMKAEALLKDQELSEKLAEAERKRFESGLSSLLIVNIREQTANDSVLKALEAVADFRKARIRYRVSKGLDPDS